MEPSESNTMIPVVDKASVETSDGSDSNVQNQELVTLRSKCNFFFKENATLNDSKEINDSTTEEVRLTVPTTDDPTLPCSTFRTWVLGTLSCAALAFLNQFFSYRQNYLSVTSVSAQIVVLLLGKLMAASLPTKAIHIPGTKWSFTMNPGPFNLKEHCLITIFANTGSTSVYAVNIITILRAFYRRRLNPVAAMLFGLLAPVPVWYFAGRYPEKKWIRLINIPIIISGTGGMPMTKAVNCICWFTVGVFFNLYVYRRYKVWWARHNYILSAGLDAGVAFMATLWWGLGEDDHCVGKCCSFFYE